MLNKNGLKDILYTLDYMHEIYNKGNWTTNDWWFLEIGIAQRLIDILVLINEDISQTL